MKTGTRFSISAVALLAGAALAEFGELYRMAAAFWIIAFVALWAAISAQF